MADLFSLVRGDLDIDPLYLPRAFVDAVARCAVGMAAIAALAPVVALACASARRGDGSRALSRASGLLLSSSAFLTGILLHNFPDEVFVNFRHAKNLAVSGRFSFYADRSVDGCVDVLYYALLAGLQRLGVDVPLGALLCGCACFAGMVYILHGYALRESGDARAAWLVGAAAIAMPSLATVAGSGWSSPFIGLLTAVAIVTWTSRLWPLTFALTGALALVRFDFSFYAVLTGALLVVAGARLQGRPVPHLVGCYVASLSCVAAILAFWLVTYGHVVPTPIVMKAGLGGSVAVLGETMIGRGLPLLLELLVLSIAPIAAARLLRRESLALGAWIVPGYAHLVLVFSAGGDYMYGNRYHTILLVASFFLCADGLAALIRAGRERSVASPDGGLARAIGRAALSLALIAIVGAMALLGGVASRLQTGARIEHEHPDWFGNGLQAMTSSRITNHILSSRFFTWLVGGSKEVKLASLEVGSIFYEYEGPTTELLGFVNREVASGPANPHPAARLWDRRLDPHGWEREHPEIIWLDTQTVAETGFGVDQVRALIQGPTGAILDTFLAWSRHGWWTKDYFAEPFLRASYVPRVTLLNGSLYVLWLARVDVAPILDFKLFRSGFTPVCVVPDPR